MQHCGLHLALSPSGTQYAPTFPFRFHQVLTALGSVDLLQLLSLQQIAPGYLPFQRDLQSDESPHEYTDVRNHRDLFCHRNPVASAVPDTSQYEVHVSRVPLRPRFWLQKLE